jgi:cyanophycinase
MSRADTTLIAMGGGEITEAKGVLDTIFGLLEKESDPHVVVMTVATNHDREAGHKYDSVFRKRNVRHVETVHINEREDAFDPASLAKIERANAIFFTGGDQLNVTSLFGGSPLHNLLHEKVDKGVVIIGTSAGAAIMSSTMIISGRSDAPPRVGCVEIAPGMDLISGTVIDTHFSQRGRHGRLLTAIAHYPQIIGIGLDEETAIIAKDHKFSVIGNGSVTVFDGSKMKHADLVYSDEDEPIGLFDVCVHVLPDGYSYDLKKRRPIAPESKRSARAVA